MRSNMTSQEKVNRIIELYTQGNSGPEISEIMGIPKSTVQRYVKLAGIVRTVEEVYKIASSKGKMARKGYEKIANKEEWKRKMHEGRLRFHAENSKGTSIKASGYIEYTIGEHKGRGVHVVMMEKRLGRRLKPDECVHHIDEDKLNNDEDNLSLMTVNGHARHHGIFRRNKI